MQFCNGNPFIPIGVIYDWEKNSETGKLQLHKRGIGGNLSETMYEQMSACLTFSLPLEPKILKDGLHIFDSNDDEVAFFHIEEPCEIDVSVEYQLDLKIGNGSSFNGLLGFPAVKQEVWCNGNAGYFVEVPYSFRQLGVELRGKLEQALGIQPSELFTLLFHASDASETLSTLTTALETSPDDFQVLDAGKIKELSESLKRINEMLANL